MLARQQAQHPRKQLAKRAGKKSGMKKKPAWDGTVSDLTVHQLSKEQLELRRSRIISKNAEKANRELEEIAKGVRQLTSASSHRSSVAGKASANAQEKELHSVLEESDRALAVVKDLFGDDPKRYTAQPNVTVAPHVTTDKSALQRTLLESQQDGPTPSALNSPGGIRDDSVLGLVPVKPALNELLSPPSEIAIDESSVDESSLLSPDQNIPTSQPHSTYLPVLVDIPRFQKLVEQHGEVEEMREGEMTSQTISNGAQHSRGGAVTLGGKAPHTLEAEQLSNIPHSGPQEGEVTVESNLTPTNIAGVQGQDITTGEKTGNSHNNLKHNHNQTQATPLTHRQQHPLQIVHKMPPTAGSGDHQSHHTSTASTTRQQMSIHGNEISRNQRVRKLPPGKAKGAVSSSKGIHDDLYVLQQLVQNLEQELQDYEQTSGYSFPVQKPTATQSGTFSSLTASLLASVTKLTHYLKQSEVQLKGEVAVRNQLLHAMAEQQNLMDALTADVVKLQEENSSLKSGFQQLEQHTTQQIKSLEEGMLELRAKLSSLEQAKSSDHKESFPTASVSTTPPGSCSEPQAASVHLPLSSTIVMPLTAPTLPIPYTSPAPTSSLPHTDDILHSTVPHVPPPPPRAEIHVSSVREAVPSSVIYARTPLPCIPHGSGIPPTPAHYVSSSTPSFLPVMSSKQPGLVPRPHILSHESTPAHPLHHTAAGAKLPSFHSPFFLAPTSLSSPLLGPTIYPSEFSVPSPPPISIALQVPSLSSRPPLPPNSLSIQPSLTPGSLPFRPSLRSSSLTFQQPLPPSLPYSWKAPSQPTSGVTMGGFSSACSTASGSGTSSVVVQSVPSTSTPPLSSNVLVGSHQPSTAAVPLPNLSLTTTSLPITETSVLSEVSPSSSSSLDIEASLARMSSLARSVLEELAQDRGQLLKVSEPGQSYLNPRPLHSYVHASHLPTISSGSSVTSVTSLDSVGSELPTTEGSVAQELSPVLGKDQFPEHLPESTAVLHVAASSEGKVSTHAHP